MSTHIHVYGGARTGKTTFINQVIAQCGNEQVMRLYRFGLQWKGGTYITAPDGACLWLTEGYTRERGADQNFKFPACRQAAWECCLPWLATERLARSLDAILSPAPTASPRARL